MRALTGAAVLAALAATASGCADMGPRPSLAAAPGRCTDQRFPVYFAPGSAALPPEALAVIRSASNRVNGCRIAAVDVTGVAAPDAAGRPADAALTQKRADAVAQALSQAGLPAPAFDVQIAGAARMPTGVRNPMSRRTEVVLHAQPG